MHFFSILVSCSMIFSSICIQYELHSSIQPENSKFLLDRLDSGDKRYDSFLLVLDLLTERQAKTLVETGTVRGGAHDFAGAGGSTIIFGDWATQNQAILYSVDINRKAVKMALSVTQPYASNINIICSDSVAFLKSFDQPIDFLYLDSYDFDCNNPGPSQRHHLKEIKAAYPHLHENSIVMIDDCDLLFGGKGVRAIKYLEEKGWKMIHNGYQVVFIR